MSTYSWAKALAPGHMGLGRWLWAHGPWPWALAAAAPLPWYPHFPGAAMGPGPWAQAQGPCVFTEMAKLHIKGIDFT